MQKVIEFIKDKGIFIGNENVIVGLSGGADSVCLLHILNNIKEVFGLKLHAVHINHMIRENAKRDEDFSVKLCEELNIPITVCKTDCIAKAKEMGISLEEAGRNERYRLFNEIGQKEFKGEYLIAIAHHGDDVAETVLFNLARGTGINGLSSIKPINGNIVRPLLCLDRNEINEYLHINNILHIEDETNQSDDYSRNKIRHQVIPVLNEITNGASNHIAQTAFMLGEIEDYLSIETNKAIEEYIEPISNGVLIKNDLTKIHDAIKKRVIHKALIMVAKRARDISSVQIEAVNDLFNLQVGRKRNLIYGMTAYRDYDGIKILQITEDLSNNDREIELAKVSIDIIDRDYSQLIPNDLYTKWLDYDKITCCPVIRFREKGDYIIINDNNDKKLLNDYMKNEKIPLDKRDSIPVVADGNHVLWVVGYRISAAAKVSESTSKILVLKYTDKEK